MTPNSKGLIKENTMHHFFKLKCRVIISLFFPLFPQIFSQIFCKGPWLVYSNITHTKICQTVF